MKSKTAQEVAGLERHIKFLEALLKLFRAKLKHARELKKRGAKND